MINDELVIRIKEDKTVRLEIREKGSTRTKLISPQTLLECIQGSLKTESICSGLLPQNVISVTMDGYGRKYITVEHLEDHADITYASTRYLNFPIPRLIFGFTVEQSGRISQVNLGVPAQGKMTAETPMFYYPFSNVQRFSLCTGANTLPRIQSLQSVQNLPYYILSLPDNDDRYSEEHNRLKLGHRDLLEHLLDKDQQYYYDQILVPMPNTTLQNFI